VRAEFLERSAGAKKGIVNAALDAPVQEIEIDGDQAGHDGDECEYVAPRQTARLARAMCRV
jgi:hypothetical protein